jgi:HAD superfamily hydrolase (TIGR01549 family)
MQPIRGIVFDLDGTLVEEQHDYEAIRRELGFPNDVPLLEGVEQLPDDRQSEARVVLYRHEQMAARTARVNPGVKRFLDWLDERGIQRGLLSRNSRAAVNVVLTRCSLTFDTIVTREDAPYKPRPHGLWEICTAWGLPPNQVLMVGDYLYDLQAGKSAGTRTALITHGRTLPFADLADIAFASFEAVPEMLLRWVDGR